MGGDRVRPGVRQPAAGRRPARRHVQPQAGLHHRSGRVRSLIGARRRRHIVRHARGRPNPAGRIRCRPRPGRPGHPGQHLPRPARAWPGVRRLRVRRGWRGRGGPHPRRPPHRVLLLALDAVRQPVLRRGRDSRRPGLHADQPAGQPSADGLGRSRARLGRPVPHRLRVLARRDRRLDRHLDHRVARRRGDPAGGVRVRREPGQSPPAAASGGPGPGQGRLLPLGRADRDRGLRRLPVPHLLPPADQGLQPGDQRAGLPADDRLHPALLEHLQHRAAAAGRATGPHRDRHAARRRCDGLPDPAHRDLQLRGERRAGAGGHGPGLRHDLLARHQHRHRRSRPARLGRSLGPGQHHAAGGRLDRDRGPEHGRAHGDRYLPDRPPHRTAGRGHGRGTRLQRGVRGVRGPVRRRCAGRGPAAAVPEPASGAAELGPGGRSGPGGQPRPDGQPVRRPRGSRRPILADHAGLSSGKGRSPALARKQPGGNDGTV